MSLFLPPGASEFERKVAVAVNGLLRPGGATLANSGVTAGSYGDSTHVAQVTVDAQGRVTAAANVAIPGVSFRGALVYQAASQTAANYTAGAAIPFDAESYDTDSIHDNVTNNTRLTVPTGVTKVKLIGAASIGLSTANTYHDLAIWKNGGFAFAGFAAMRSSAPSTDANVVVLSPVLAVTAGDYFELKLTSQSDTSITLNSPRTWFAMEIIE